MYLGASKTSFKLGFGNHKKSFNVEKDKKDTKLLEEYWRIKELNVCRIIKIQKSATSAKMKSTKSPCLEEAIF